MRKISISIISMLFLLLFTIPSISQDKKMTWTTQSKQAREFAMSGANHMLNAEFEQAYTDFSAALKQDPDFTVVLAFMSNLSRGEKRKVYAEKTLKSASNKTEGEKLFASLVDGKSTEEVRRGIWSKLHSMFPDDEMLSNSYVQTRATPEERFAAAEEYIKRYPAQPAMYNTTAYYYMLDKKDNEMAKKNFEKY